MTEHFDAARRLASRLSNDELQRLITYAKSLIKAGPRGDAAPQPETGRSPEPDIDWLLEGIYHALRTRGLLGANERLPPEVIRAHAPQYTEQSAAARALLLARLDPPPPTAAELMALGRVCGECLADRIAEWPNVPLGVRVMLRLVHRVPEAVEASFPGYLRAGMLRILLRSHGSMLLGGR